MRDDASTSIRVVGSPNVDDTALRAAITDNVAIGPRMQNAGTRSVVPADTATKTDTAPDDQVKCPVPGDPTRDITVMEKPNVLL